MNVRAQYNKYWKYMFKYIQEKGERKIVDSLSSDNISTN